MPRRQATHTTVVVRNLANKSMKKRRKMQTQKNNGEHNAKKESVDHKRDTKQFGAQKLL